MRTKVYVTATDAPITQRRDTMPAVSTSQRRDTMPDIPTIQRKNSKDATVIQRRNSVDSVDGLNPNSTGHGPDSGLAEVDEFAEEELPLMEKTRLIVKKFMATSIIGHGYQNIMLLLSILSAIQFIYQTYLDPNKPKEKVLLSYVPISITCLTLHVHRQFYISLAI